MGLFDFAKNIGTKLFGEKDEPVTQAEKIKAHIETDNPGISDLDVAVNKGVVAMSGEAVSGEALEKAVLLAGNVEGVEKVMAVTVKEADVPKVEYYEIAAGDSLSAIAKKFYGDAQQYPRLFEANREVIKDPDKIYPGQKIRIPLDSAVV
ncbi:MAG: peptidoglycan-binding protein LysM [Gammaproteobacteria bacterium]|nr:peptidoglycan-binding protein LysM [Gammaproteobacteria bacterium]MDH3769224.1 peptidoglycan-binding protein LysM [Gammaproteobacteria bacterium]